MRKLTESLMILLQHGFLPEITKRIRSDSDQDLEINDNYFNPFYKGNSHLKLTDAGSNYRVEIHKKCLEGIEIPNYTNDQKATQVFIENFPICKRNIIDHGQHSTEIECEQLIIRANKNGPRGNNE